MKIAIIGIRGIPVAYSTFETFAETLSTEMVKRGHTVSVYCRSSYIKDKKPYYGVDRISLPSIETKHLSTFSHSFLSTIHAMIFRKYDIILYLAVGNTFFSIFPRFFGAKTIVHIDGFDWERKKWGFIAKIYLKLSVFLTTVFPNTVISDNVFMVDFYKKAYKKEIQNIPYGYFPQNISNSRDLLKKYGLKKKEYFVWVGRLVPENNLEELLGAFNLLKSNIKCLVIGDDLFESSYKTKIYDMAKRNKKVIRIGFIPHEEVVTLVANAKAYIETKRNGGTQMALIEAMGTGVPIISNDSQEHKNILGDTAVYYNPKNEKKELVTILKAVSKDTKENFSLLGKLSQKRAKQKYQWEKIIDRYEKLFYFTYRKPFKEKI